MIYLLGDNELIHHNYGTEINVDRMPMQPLLFWLIIMCLLCYNYTNNSGHSNCFFQIPSQQTVDGLGCKYHPMPLSITLHMGCMYSLLACV